MQTRDYSCCSVYLASMLCSGLIVPINACQKYYVVDDKLKDYVMGSAHKKWRDFKSELKQKYFKPEQTDEELYALIKKKDSRVSVDDMEWLVKFWRNGLSFLPTIHIRV